MGKKMGSGVAKNPDGGKAGGQRKKGSGLIQNANGREINAVMMYSNK